MSTSVESHSLSEGLIESANVRAIVLRCANGEEVAWSELFDLFHGPLRSRIRGFLGNHRQDDSLVDEIASEVWLGLLQQGGRQLLLYRPASSFLAYLSGIARYEALAYFRSDRRRRAREADNARQSPEGRVTWQEYTDSELSEFLATLTPRERQFVESLLVPRNGTAGMEISPANHWQLRHRVRRKLCAFLEQ